MSARAPILVGLVALVSAAGVSWLMLTTNKNKFSDDATYPIYADFADASGIRQKTRVQANGIDIGKIANIEHVRSANGRLTARITLRIGNDYAVYADAQVRRAAESLLGDFRIDLDPGSAAARQLKPGEGIATVHSLSDIDEIKSELLHVVKNVNRITETFVEVLAGPDGRGSLVSIMAKVENSMAAIEKTTESLQRSIAGNDQVIEQIIHDVGHVTAAMAHISLPGGDLRTTSHNLATLSTKVDRMADTVAELLGTPAGDDQSIGASHAKGELASLRTTLGELNESLHHIGDITRKIDEGQGTLGRVVNDPGIADRVEETLDSANQIIGSIAHLETKIELRSEYDVPFRGTNNQIQPAIKNTVGLRILPKPDKFYILEAVSDPRGNQTRSLTTTSVNGSTIASDETTISFNDLKFSAEFAKRYYFATLRFGIIENTGGLGLDLHFLDDRAEVRIDAFDFSRRNPSNLETIFPRLRATGMYELVGHISVQAGFDDPFNTDLRVWFLGGVLRFTDDDLKGLLAVAPKP